MTWSVRNPVLRTWRATEDLSPEIAKDVAANEEHYQPGDISKRLVDSKQTEVEYKNRHFVAKQAN